MHAVLTISQLLDYWEETARWKKIKLKRQGYFLLKRRPVTIILMSLFNLSLASTATVPIILVSLVKARLTFAPPRWLSVSSLLLMAFDWLTRAINLSAFLAWMRTPRSTALGCTVRSLNTRTGIPLQINFMQRCYRSSQWISAIMICSVMYKTLTWKPSLRGMDFHLVLKKHMLDSKNGKNLIPLQTGSLRSSLIGNVSLCNWKPTQKTVPKSLFHHTADGSTKGINLIGFFLRLKKSNYSDITSAK